MLELWLARDYDGPLYAFINEPQLGLSKEVFVPAGLGSEKTAFLPSEWFPEVTFENSPVKMVLSEQLVASIQAEGETESVKRRR